MEDGLYARVRFLSLFLEWNQTLLKMDIFGTSAKMAETLRGIQKTLVVISKSARADAQAEVSGVFSPDFIWTFTVQNNIKPTKPRPPFSQVVRTLDTICGKALELIEAFKAPDQPLGLRFFMDLISRFSDGYQNFFLRSIAFNTLISANEFNEGQFYHQLYLNTIGQSFPRASRDPRFEAEPLHQKFALDATAIYYDVLTKLPFAPEKRRNYFANCLGELLHYFKMASHFDSKFAPANTHALRYDAGNVLFGFVSEITELGLKLGLYLPNDYLGMLMVLIKCHEMQSFAALGQLNLVAAGFVRCWELGIPGPVKDPLDAHAAAAFRDFALHRLAQIQLSSLLSFVAYFVTKKVRLSSAEPAYLSDDNFVVSEESGESVVRLSAYQQLVIAKRWRPFMDPGLSFLVRPEKIEATLTGHLKVTSEQLLEKIRGDSKEATELWKKCAGFPQVPEEIRKEVETAGRRVLALGLDLHKEVIGQAWVGRGLSLQMEGAFIRLAH